MHYMLLIYSDENDWTETEREACMLASMAICDELIEQGTHGCRHKRTLGCLQYPFR